MKTLFVITTVNLPVSSSIGECNCDSLEQLITDKIMICEDGETNTIRSYLKGYRHTLLETCPHVQKKLGETDHLPIIVRRAGDYVLVITLCLSSDIAPRGGRSGHNYIAELVEFAKKKVSFKSDDDHLFVFAHDLDLIKNGTTEVNNRFLSSSEYQDKLAKIGLDDRQVYVYQHKSGMEIYETLICSLSEPEDVLQGKCDEVVDFLKRL